jgi:hypothetical protein
LYHSDLDRLLPRISSPVVSPLPASYTIGIPRLTHAALFLQLATNLIPLVFFIYAFWQLFLTNGVTDVLVWVSMAGTLLFLFSPRALHSPVCCTSRDGIEMSTPGSSRVSGQGNGKQLRRVSSPYRTRAGRVDLLLAPCHLIMLPAAHLSAVECGRVPPRRQ